MKKKYEKENLDYVSLMYRPEIQKWITDRLNGSENEKYGLARTMSVMPGDTVNIEVYAKYVDPSSTGSENAIIRYRELEGLEKMDFMVAIYEQDQKPYGGYPLYSNDPTFNKSPGQVINSTSDQYLNFQVDLGTGELLTMGSGDNDKNSK